MALPEAPTCPCTKAKLRTVPKSKGRAAYQYCPTCKRNFETSVPDKPKVKADKFSRSPFDAIEQG